MDRQSERWERRRDSEDWSPSAARPSVPRPPLPGRRSRQAGSPLPSTSTFHHCLDRSWPRRAPARDRTWVRAGLSSTPVGRRRASRVLPQVSAGVSWSRQPACRPSGACFFPVDPPRRGGRGEHLPPLVLHSPPPRLRPSGIPVISTKAGAGAGLWSGCWCAVV